MSYRSHFSGNCAGNATSIRPHSPGLTASMAEKSGEERGCMDVPVCHLWPTELVETCLARMLIARRDGSKLRSGDRGSARQDGLAQSSDRGNLASVDGCRLCRERDCTSRWQRADACCRWRRIGASMTFVMRHSCPTYDSTRETALTEI